MQGTAQHLLRYRLAAIDHRPENGLRGVQSSPHAHVLRALAGEEEGDARQALRHSAEQYTRFGLFLGQHHALGADRRQSCLQVGAICGHDG